MQDHKEKLLIDLWIMNTLSSITWHVPTVPAERRKVAKPATWDARKSERRGESDIRTTRETQHHSFFPVDEEGKWLEIWQILAYKRETEWIWGLHVPITKIKTVAGGELARSGEKVLKACWLIPTQFFIMTPSHSTQEKVLHQLWTR